LLRAAEHSAVVSADTALSQLWLAGALR